MDALEAVEEAYTLAIGSGDIIMRQRVEVLMRVRLESLSGANAEFGRVLDLWVPEVR